MVARRALAVVAVLALAVAGCSGSAPATTVTPPPAATRAISAEPAAPVVPNRVAHPMSVGGTATLIEVDPRDGGQQSDAVTLDSAGMLRYTDAENVTKPYLIATVTIVCHSGPCLTGEGNFTVHETGRHRG